MIETSKDILFLVLAFSIASITFFLCWALYLMIKVMRQINETVSTVKEKIESVTGVIEMIKDKIVNSASAINGIAQAVNKIIDFVKTRKEKKGDKNRKKSVDL